MQRITSGAKISPGAWNRSEIDLIMITAFQFYFFFRLRYILILPNVNPSNQDGNMRGIAEIGNEERIEELWF
jgi:hypothetical protein